jgi:hypothetical protein
LDANLTRRIGLRRALLGAGLEFSGHADPSVSSDTLSIAEVRNSGERDAGTPRATSPIPVIVKRPAGATQGETSSVFVLVDNGRRLHRVAVQYGRASSDSIEVLTGVSAGDRIVVSDMSPWDAFEQLRIK